MNKTYVINIKKIVSMEINPSEPYHYVHKIPFGNVYDFAKSFIPFIPKPIKSDGNIWHDELVNTIGYISDIEKNNDEIQFNRATNRWEYKPCVAIRLIDELRVFRFYNDDQLTEFLTEFNNAYVLADGDSGKPITITLEMGNYGIWKVVVPK